MSLHRLTATTALLALLAACAPAPESEAPPEASRGASGNSFEGSAFECLREAIYFEAAASNPNGPTRSGRRDQEPQARSPFPNTICGVIKDRCQFSYRCDGIPESFPDKIKFRNATAIAREALAEADKDITNGAGLLPRSTYGARLVRYIGAHGHVRWKYLLQRIKYRAGGSARFSEVVLSSLRVNQNPKRIGTK